MLFSLFAMGLYGKNEVRSVIFVKIVSNSVTHYNKMNELEVFCYQF